MQYNTSKGPPLKLQTDATIYLSGAAEQDGGGHVPPPSIFLKLQRISKKKCLVPPPPNIELLTVPPNLKVTPRSLFVSFQPIYLAVQTSSIKPQIGNIFSPRR